MIDGFRRFKRVSAMTVLCLVGYSKSTLASVEVVVHFSPVANLVYQLDCVTGVLARCSKDSFESLWSQHFIRSDLDRSKMELWYQLAKKYSKTFEFTDSTAMPIPGRFEGLDIGTKMRTAALQALKPSEYFERLDLVVQPKDRIRIEQIFFHFWPRFSSWWQKEALSNGTKFKKDTESLLKDKKMSNMIKKLSNFYRAEIPRGLSIHLNLIFRPEHKEATSGEYFENHAIVEFLSKEQAKARIDVIIHEICHFFFRMAPDRDIVNLQNRFEALKQMEARAAYYLLDEALATAFGNGLISKHLMSPSHWQKYLEKENSLYNNPAIDLAAKTILPWLETFLDKGGTLFDESFVEKYLELLKGAFGKRLSAPRLGLLEVVVVADLKFDEKVIDSVRTDLGSASIFSSRAQWSEERLLKTFNEKSSLGAVIFVHGKNRQMLVRNHILTKGQFSVLDRHFNKQGAVLFSLKRTLSSKTYVIVANQDEQAIALVKALGSLYETFEGVLNLK